MKRTISVVFSFRNEAQNIPELLNRTRSAILQTSHDYELIFVNDSSTDQSLEILLEAHKADPRVKIINMSRRWGVYECILAGLNASTGDAVIYLDSDLQDPPELIPRLVTEWENGAEVVHTVRSRRLGEHPFKLWLTALAYRAIRYFSTIDIPVDCGDFKLVSRRALDHILKCPEKDPYWRGMTVWVGFAQAFVIYERAARFSGKTQVPLLRARLPWKVFTMGVTSFSFTPLYAISLLGGLGLGISMLTLLVALAMALGNGGGGGLALAAGILFLWSSLMTALGIVALYVARIFKESRNRPPYIIGEAIGFEQHGVRLAITKAD